MTLKLFIDDLDSKEVYEFAILNPFLVNEEELQKLINDINKIDYLGAQSEEEEEVKGNLKLDIRKIEESESENENEDEYSEESNE